MMQRRQMLALGAALGTPAVARAQDNWPNRPVTLLVPFAAGGSNDVVARLVAPALEQKFGQPFNDAENQRLAKNQEVHAAAF